MADRKENPFLNLGFNIILPVLILNKGEKFISVEPSAVFILILALAFPFLYGLKDFIKNKKINWLSIIGLVSILLTGGLALLKLEGIYFAVKEAGIPLLLALIFIVSVFFKKPLAHVFIFKSSLFDTKLIQNQLQLNNNEKKFENLMIHSTLLLSASFILSAILNFLIAMSVFTDMDPQLAESAKETLINKQVADMTWMGYVFIALPLTVVTGFLFWWILKKLKLLTGLTLEELIPQMKKDLKQA
ncbi:MAG: hypothetical protein OXJ52_04920 [Oligoflexia bacterium]|nr:hypothetical protein [Oligoflexia bacterium]